MYYEAILKYNTNMKLKFVFISLLFCCFVSQVEAQEDQNKKNNNVGVVSSFRFSDVPSDLLNGTPFEIECPLTIHYVRTLTPKLSVGFRLGFFLDSDFYAFLYSPFRQSNKRVVYSLFSRVSVYSTEKFNAYVRPELSYGAHLNALFVRNSGAKLFFKPAVDIGCRYRLSERLSLVFEKELLKYIFLFSEEEELYSLLGMSTFINGVRLGVEMGF